MKTSKPKNKKPDNMGTENKKAPYNEAGEGHDIRDEDKDNSDVDEAIEETFPASDPPSWMPGAPGTVHQHEKEEK